ncbi:MAG: 2-amino-4-hydroxy-6-hydroxymethyldihydropteridine diphosphokinase [Sulfitobacter sp.]
MQSKNLQKQSETRLISEKLILLAIGANLGSKFGAPAQSIVLAFKELANRGAVIRDISPLYSTPAFPVGNGPDYVNAAASFTVKWSAARIMEVFHEIEFEFGRERQQRWGQRTLDIDLIAIDDLVLPDLQTHKQWRDLPPDAQLVQTPDQLILPHPRLQDRGFVLVPLADIAPDWRHPVLGKTVRQMCDALPDEAKKGVVRL